MSFERMKRDDLYDLAVNNFAVEVDERATKPQIIAALVEEGVTWDMAKSFDSRAAEIAEAEEAGGSPGAITTASLVVTTDNVVDPVVSTFPAPDLNATDENFIRVPKGVDGYVRNNVFTPADLDVEAPKPSVVLIKMERENPSYEVAGYKFTRQNPFALVKGEDADHVLRHEQGFKIASPAEAQEFYG